MLYNDIFAVRTRCVQRENGSSISKIQPKGFVWRRYRKYIIMYSRNFLFRRFRERIISFFCKFILFSLILLLACFIFAFLVSAFGMPCFCCSSSAFDLRVFIFLPQLEHYSVCYYERTHTPALQPVHSWYPPVPALLPMHRGFFLIP